MLKPGQTQNVVLIITARAIDIYREIKVLKTWIIKKLCIFNGGNTFLGGDHEENCTKNYTEKSRFMRLTHI